MQIIRKGSTAKEFETPRIMTGLYSFDWAFIDNKGKAGLPLRSIIEIVGHTGVGKSTVMLYLGGLIAKKTSRNLYLLDMERQNESTVSTCLESSGFTGEFIWDVAIEEFEFADEKKKKDTAQKTKDLMDFVDMFHQREHPVAMLDSIAIWQPPTVVNSDPEDKNIGVKATYLRRWFEKMLIPLTGHPTPPIMFFTNHLTQDPGGFRPSFNSPIPTVETGGTATRYCKTQSIMLSNLFGFSYPEQHGWVAQGKVKKNRDGYGIESKQVFYLYIQAGEGVSRNLTAVIDCFMLGLCKSSSKSITESSKISMDGVEYGKFRDLIADRFDDSKFQDFHNALQAQSGGIQEASTEVGGE